MHARVYVPSLWKTGCPKYEHQCRSDRDGWSLDAAGMEEGCHGDAFDVRSNKVLNPSTVPSYGGRFIGDVDLSVRQRSDGSVHHSDR